MKKLYIIILVVVLGLVCWFLYEKLAYLNIVVKFDDIEPLEKQMGVYYKGFKIGKTTKIYPDKDYTNTYLKLKIKPRNINLPSNITANIKRMPTKEYVSIKYPDSPTLKRIKNNMKIKGTVSKDIKNVISDSIEAEDIDTIVNEATTLMDSATATVQNIGQTFSQINQMLNEINADVKRTASNLAKTTGSIANISDNLDNALDRNTTKNSFDNLNETTENIKNITNNLNEITYQIEEDTIPMVNSVLCGTNATMENAEEITSGIKHTLKKRMGLWRLMFGKPINNCKS
ncbi:MCE family protein [bacterium]|nr:MCE family protein [bacterium]